MKRTQHTTYDKFRGSEALIKSRLKKYIKYFDSCRNVLDIGCGRGEFLELLKDRQIPAIGIDSDANMVDICSRKGLKVLQMDAYSFLKDKTGVFDGIFCSQVIEHLDPQDATDLLNFCQKALKPQGILVIITPNPRNINVITETFWLDLTHKRPYPLELLKELLSIIYFEIIASGEDKDTISNNWLKGKLLYKLDKRLTHGLFLG